MSDGSFCIDKSTGVTHNFHRKNKVYEMEFEVVPLQEAKRLFGRQATKP